jgi:hypothetical protein
MLACGGVLGSECDEAVDSNKEFMDRLVMGFICKDSALHVRDEGFLSGKYCRTDGAAAVPMQVPTKPSGWYPLSVYAFPFLHIRIRGSVSSCTTTL